MAFDGARGSTLLKDDVDIGTLIRSAREAKDWSQSQLAQRVGTSQQTIDKIETGKVKKSSFLGPIAKALGIPIERVLKLDTLGAHIGQAISGRSLVGERDLPVYAVALGEKRVLIVSEEPVEHMARPEPLALVRDGYGIIVPDDSMLPEFEAGDIALVNPHMPVRPGDTCLFVCTESGEKHARLARLRKITERDWLVFHWNAAEGGGKQDFALRRIDWGTVHLIVGRYNRR